MHCLKYVLLSAVFLLQALGAVWADELRLTDSTVMRGEIIHSFNDQGVVMRMASGDYSERVPWNMLTQESLKELAKIPDAKPYASAYIEVPIEVKQKAKRKEIVIKPVATRLELPAEKPSFIAAITSPAGLAILLILLAANIYAGYEIAHYRNQPVAVVCAVSAIAPILGPIVFLSLPTHAPADGGDSVGQEGEELVAAGGGAPAGKTTGPMQPQPVSSLSIAAQQKPTAAKPGTEPKIYRRSEHTINRRFIETQFPGFFRVVPSEAEKDLLIVFKTGRSEFMSRRITRISATDVHLQVLSGVGEVSVPLAEITEIHVRNKDGKEK